MKWGMPHFMHHGILAGMSAFKAHCAFGFWKGALVAEAMGVTGAAKSREAMGDFGRIASVRDLPPRRELVRWVKAAMRLNEQGARRPLKRPAVRKPIPVPADLARALRTHATARATWEGFSPSHRREYLEWITEAKTAPTRERRLATTLEWLAAGKSRHRKYR
jgi:uncharacterized protein YdeI (YjbR/CyaY-like superfamily)